MRFAYPVGNSLITKVKSTIITEVYITDDDTADIAWLSEVDCPPRMFLHVSSARLGISTAVVCLACSLVAVACTDLIGRLV